jgi:hypothetical protein
MTSLPKNGKPWSELEYAIDIGITTSPVDVIIRVGRDPAPAAD